MEQKTITISTIPIPKLTTLMNNFICNTITHLNKLSVKGDEKLAEFDKKLNDLEIMTTLLEAKLNSLPEKITSTYPPLQQCTLDDVNPSIIPNVNSNVEEGSGSGVPVPPPPPPPQPPQPDGINQQTEDKGDNENTENKDEEGGETGGDNVSPQEALDNFLKQNEKYRTLDKMISYGVPLEGVRQKAKINGFDMDLLEELINLERKVKPNI